MLILQKLSEAEEQLGKIYKSIAEHYKKNSEKYQCLSTAIEGIANDEFAHRDFIRNEMKKHQSKQPQEVTPTEKGLSYQEYKKVQSTLVLMKNNLEDLNLRDNEKASINCELDLIGQSLEASRKQIGNSFFKCQDILKNLNTNSKSVQLIDELQKIRK